VRVTIVNRRSKAGGVGGYLDEFLQKVATALPDNPRDISCCRLEKNATAIAC
jgi:hypothetical protein